MGFLEQCCNSSSNDDGNITPQDYFNFQKEETLFKLVEKNEDDQFPLKISKKEKLTHDTYLFELEFPSKSWVSGLWVGGHFVFHAHIDGKLVSRKYTPISPINERGRALFAIKIYRPNEEFPKGGKFTQWLESQEVGDEILCEGPIGKLKYHGWGKFDKLRKSLPTKKNVGLIAAGSGITPMLAIAQASSLASDGLNIRFLYCNKTKDDIMCMDTLQSLRASSFQFKLHHTLTRHNPETHGAWDGQKGRPTLKMIQSMGFPPPAEDTLIAVCGPDGFNKSIAAFLKEAGYEDHMLSA